MLKARSLAFCILQVSLLWSTGSLLPVCASSWEECKKAGDAAYEAGNYAAAEKHFQEALKAAESFNDNDKRLATTTYNLALVMQTQERFQESEQMYARALELLAKAYGENSDRVVHVYNQLAELHKAQNDLHGSEECYQKALAISEKGFGNDKPETAFQLDVVADFYNEQEQFDKAEPLYKRSLDISTRALGADKPETGKRQSRLAEFYFNQGQYAAAQPRFETALRIADAGTKDGPESGRLCVLIGNLYSEWNNPTQAEPYYRRAAAIAERQAPRDVPLLETNLAATLDAQKKFSQAIPLYEDALRRLAETADTTTLLLCLKNYQKHFSLQNKTVEAAKVAVRIKDVRSKMAPPAQKVTEFHSKKIAPISKH